MSVALILPDNETNIFSHILQEPGIVFSDQLVHCAACTVVYLFLFFFVVELIELFFV